MNFAPPRASFVLNIAVKVVIFSALYGLWLFWLCSSRHLVGATKGVSNSPPATLMKSSPVALYTSIYLLPMWCLCLLRAISRWEPFSNSTNASPFLRPCGDKQRATPAMRKCHRRNQYKRQRRLLVPIVIHVLFSVFMGVRFLLGGSFWWAFMVGLQSFFSIILTFLPSSHWFFKVELSVKCICYWENSPK